MPNMSPARGSDGIFGRQLRVGRRAGVDGGADFDG
jgi:hypothetical protein